MQNCTPDFETTCNSLIIIAEWLQPRSKVAQHPRNAGRNDRYEPDLEDFFASLRPQVLRMATPGTQRADHGCCEMHESARVLQGRPATGTLAHVCPDLAIRDVHIRFLSFPGEDDRVISIIWRGCSSAPEPKALIKSSGSLPFADHLPPRAHPLQDPTRPRSRQHSSAQALPSMLLINAISLAFSR
jgi:hypothetical protein